MGRTVVSVWLIIHLTAVLVPPFSLQSTSPISPSPVADSLMRALRPYIDLLFLNHGYAFFAPDPGPSHLLRAKMEFDDGRQPLVLMFPDLKREQPRLLYHRHFMLSEQLHSQFVPPEPPEAIARQPAALESWQHGRLMYDLKWKSFENHLRSTYGASQVTLTRIEHRMIDVYEVEELHRRLDDRETYFNLSENAPGEELP